VGTAGAGAPGRFKPESIGGLRFKSELRYCMLLYATLRYSTLLYATLRYSTLRYAVSPTTLSTRRGTTRRGGRGGRGGVPKPRRGEEVVEKPRGGPGRGSRGRIPRLRGGHHKTIDTFAIYNWFIGLAQR
jgi:hypothetical protein